jgi:hypothetical protein
MRRQQKIRHEEMPDPESEAEMLSEHCNCFLLKASTAHNRRIPLYTKDRFFRLETASQRKYMKVALRPHPPVRARFIACKKRQNYTEKSTYYLTKQKLGQAISLTNTTHS